MQLRPRPALANVDLFSLWDPTFIAEKHIITSKRDNLAHSKRPKSVPIKPQWHYFISKNPRLWADNIISDALNILEECYRSIDFLLLRDADQRKIELLRLQRSSLKTHGTTTKESRSLSSKDEMLHGLMGMFRSSSASFVKEGSEDLLTKNMADWTYFIEKLEPISLFGSDPSRLDSITQYFVEFASSSPHRHLKMRALETLLRFSIASGSFRGLLATVCIAVEDPTIIGKRLNDAFQTLKFQEFAHQSVALTSWAALGKYASVWPVAIRTPLMQPIPTLMTSELMFSSISCSNDGFLFIFDENMQSIIKVGTGYGKTLQGHEYGSRRVESLVIGLACIRDKLFILRNSTMGEELLCIEYLDLSDPDVFVSGDPVPCALGSALMLSDDSLLCGGDDKHIFILDSLNLFICEPSKPSASGKKKKATLMSPSEPSVSLQLKRTVKLAPPEDNEDALHEFPISPSSCSIYTNGHYLCATCVDCSNSNGPSYTIVEPRYASYTWDITTGALLDFRVFEQIPFMLGRTSCYDIASNVIWTYSAFGSRVGISPNTSGIAPQVELHDRLALKPPDSPLEMLRYLETLAGCEMPPLISGTQPFVPEQGPPSRPFALESTFVALEQVQVAIESALKREHSEAEIMSLLAILECVCFWYTKRSRESSTLSSLSSFVVSLIWGDRVAMSCRLRACRILAVGWQVLAPTREQRISILSKMMGSFASDDFHPSHDVGDSLALFEVFLQVLVVCNDNFNESTEVFRLFGFVDLDNDDEHEDSEHIQNQARSVWHGLFRMIDTASPSTLFSSNLIRTFVTVFNTALAAAERTPNSADAQASALFALTEFASYCQQTLSSTKLTDSISAVTLFPFFCDIAMSCSNVELAFEFLEPIKSCTLAIASLLTDSELSDSNLESDINLIRGDYFSAARPQAKVIESSHPAVGRDAATYVVRIPGATSLCIEFDPLCELSNVVGAYVQMYTDPARNTRIGPQFTGYNFPDQVIVPGDTAVLHFHYPVDALGGTTTSGGFTEGPSDSADWGFRCTVIDWGFDRLSAFSPNPISTASMLLYQSSIALGHLLALVTAPSSELESIAASTEDLEQKFGKNLKEHGDVEVAISAVQNQEGQAFLGTVIRSPLFKYGLLPQRGKLHSAVSSLLQFCNDGSAHAQAASSNVAKFMTWFSTKLHGTNKSPHPQFDRLDAIALAAILHVAADLRLCDAVAGGISAGGGSSAGIEALLDVNLVASFRTLRNSTLLRAQQTAQQKNTSAGFSTQASDALNLRRGRIYMEVCRSVIEKALLILQRPTSAPGLPVPAAVELVFNFMNSAVHIDVVRRAIDAAENHASRLVLFFQVGSEMALKLRLPVLCHFMSCCCINITQKVLSGALTRIPSLLLDHVAGARFETLQEIATEFQKSMEALQQATSALKKSHFLPRITVISSLLNLGPLLDGEHLTRGLVTASAFVPLNFSKVVANHLPGEPADKPTLISAFTEQVGRDVAWAAFLAIAGSICKHPDRCSADTIRMVTSSVLDNLDSVSGFPNPIMSTRQLLCCLVGLLQASDVALQVACSPHAVRSLIDLSSGPSLGDPITQTLLFRVLRLVLIKVDPKSRVPSKYGAAESTETVERVLYSLGTLKAVEAENPPSPRHMELFYGHGIAHPLSIVPYAIDLSPSGAPLPTKLVFSETVGPAELSDDGYQLSHSSAPADSRLLVLARTDVPIPDDCMFYYFEVTVAEEGAAIALGFYPPSPTPLAGMPGWHYGSYGFHSDDGNKFCFKWEGSGSAYGPRWSQKGTVVGALLNRRDSTISFTCNGVNCGIAFANVEGSFCPVVSVHADASIQLNLGQRPFQYPALSAKVPPMEHNPGENPMEHAKANAVYLLRILHKSNPTWRDAVNSFICNSINGVLPVLNPKSPRTTSPAVTSKRGSNPAKKLKRVREDASIFEKAHLAAQIMGGFVPVLRIGAYVTSTDYRDQGVICQMSTSNVKLLREYDQSPGVSSESSINHDILVVEFARIAPVEAGVFDFDSFMPRIDDIAECLAVLAAPQQPATAQTPVEHTSLQSLISHIRLAISASMSALLSHPLAVANKTVRKTLIPAVLHAALTPIAHATTLPTLRQLVPSVVFVESPLNASLSPLFRKKRYLAAIRLHMSLLQAEKIAEKKPKQSRRGSKQMPTKSNTADSEFRKALQEGGFTFADVRKLREAFAMFDLDQDGYISLDEFLVVSDTLGNKTNPSDLMQAFKRMDLGGTGRVSFLDFVKFSASNKRQATAIRSPASVHVGFVCAMCGQSPILGTRFCNAMRTGEHLCSQCFSLGSPDAPPTPTAASVSRKYRRNPLHLFYKVCIAFPPKNQCSQRVREVIYAGKDCELPLLENLYQSSKPPKSRRHEGVTCSACGCSPIVGTRFISLTMRDYNICQDCEPKESTDNLLLVVEYPLPKGAFPAQKTPLLPNDLYTSTVVVHDLRLEAVRPGSVVSVARADISGFGFWSPVMNDTLGMAGIVEAIDTDEELVLVRFVDVSREVSRKHWYPVACLEPPATSAIPTAFFVFSELSGAHSVEMALEGDLTILQSRASLSAALRCMSENLSPKRLIQTINSSLQNGRALLELIRLYFFDGIANVVADVSTFTFAASPELDIALQMIDKLSKANEKISSGASSPRDDEEESVLDLPVSCATVTGEKRKWKKASLRVSSNNTVLTRKDGTNLLTSPTPTIVVASPSSALESDSKKRPFQLELRPLDSSSSGAVLLAFKGEQDLAEVCRVFTRASSPDGPQWNPKRSLSENLIEYTLSDITKKRSAGLDRYVVVEESSHPYTPATAFRRFVHVEMATVLVVFFDPQCHTQAGVDFLTFWQDPGLREPLAVFHGKGIQNFPCTIIRGNQFWVTFETDPTDRDGQSYWGYKFTVVPLVPAIQSPVAPIFQQNSTTDAPDKNLQQLLELLFDLQLLSWLVDSATQGKSIALKRQICSNKRFFDSLWGFCISREDYSGGRARTLLIINRLVRNWIPNQDAPAPVFDDVLLRVEKDVLKFNEFEQTSVAHSFSVQYKIVAELAVNTAIALASLELPVPVSPVSGEAVQESPSMRHGPKPTASPKTPKRTVQLSSTLAKWPNRVRALHLVTRTLASLLDGQGFPSDVLKRAFTSERFRSKQFAWVEESSHPYLPNSDSASIVSFRGAKELLIEFDPRCNFVPHGAILIFESSNGQELARFADNVFPQRFRMPVDTFIWKFISGRAYPEWGFRFTVTPALDRRTLADKIQRSEILFRIANETQHLWDLEMDQKLVRWVNATLRPRRMHSEHSIPTGVHESVCFSIADCDPNQLSTFLAPSPVVSDIDLIECRLELLKYLNYKIGKCLPLVHLSLTHQGSSLASLFAKAKSLIFARAKSDWLSAVLQESSTNLLRPKLQLKRRQQQRQQDLARARNPQPGTKLYEQVMDQLLNIDPARLQRNDRAFEVAFDDEGAHDIGGPYRETLTQICAEIESVPELFIPTPNQSSNSGEDQDKVMPNPSLNTENIRAFEFVGRLIGIAVRTRTPLDFNWPLMIWKPLVGQTVDLNDLELVDFHSARLIQSILGTPSGASIPLTPENFDDAMAHQCFVATTFDGRTVPLVQGGDTMQVTWANRIQFGTLLRDFKLSELHQQTEAMIRGMASVVPKEHFFVFTAAELEARVCGQRTVDAVVLQNHTKYAVGVDPSSPYVRWFWRIVRGFSDEQRHQLLRFISGRSRLPSSSEWSLEFTINPFIPPNRGSPDRFLPVAHTCFFSLDLPEYSSEDIMREKLIYAITYCMDIDADFVQPRPRHH